MRPFILVLLLAALPVIAVAQTTLPTVVLPGQDVRRNGPGLECRQTPGHVPAFEFPIPGSRIMAHMPEAVAVTGPARNGFVPVALNRGMTAWVRERETWPTSRLKKCFIQRTANGTLRWSKFNRI